MTTVDHDTAVDPIPSPEATAAADVSGGMPGSVAAALLACGVGCTVFGVSVVLTEASKTVKTVFTLHEEAGPLSGKSLMGTAGYLLAWLLLYLVLHLALSRRTVSRRTTMIVTWSLVGVGLLLTFPPVFQLFAPAAPIPAHPGPLH